MLAIWLENQRLTVRDDVPFPQPADGEALVRVIRAGVCSTDIELTRGYYPYTGVLGHEFVGVVERGPDALLGHRVVGEINAVCGRCAHCAAGRTNHCSNRTVLGIVGRNGAFAEHLVLPAENLHVVPDKVSSDEATFVEPLAAALEIQEQVEVAPENRVLVVGDGRLGQLVAQTLVLTGCELLVVGRNRTKLSLLAGRGIATATAGESLSPGFDVVVECTGNPDGFEVAQNFVRPRGTIVLKSTYAGSVSVDAAAVVVNEITLIGSRCGPFAPALELLAEGAVDVAPMIHGRYELRDGIEAVERAAQPGVLKVLIDTGSE